MAWETQIQLLSPSVRIDIDTFHAPQQCWDQQAINYCEWRAGETLSVFPVELRPFLYFHCLWTDLM